MISMLKIMIFVFFRIFIKSENAGIMLDKDIRGIGFRGCGNVENNRGVGRDVFGYCKALENGLLKKTDRICGKSTLKKCNDFNEKRVENNSVNCPFSGHGVQILDKTCPFSGHGVHFLDIINPLISLTLK